MQTPKRKPGKYSHLKPDPHMTLEKYRKLQNELKKLKEIHQPPAIREVKRLALMGDFSENAAYQIAKGRLRGINQRITDINDHLRRAEIIENKPSTNAINLGTTAYLLIDGEEKVYTLLGSSETDISKGVISHNSPLGKAIIGKKIGEKTELLIGKKRKTIEIMKIE